MMNRSVFQSSSSCLWSSTSINPSSSTPPSLFPSSSSSSSLPSTFLPFSQLLLGGGDQQMDDEEERYLVYGLHDDDDHHQVFGIKGEKSYGAHEEEEEEEDDEIIHATTTTSGCQALQSLNPSLKSCVTTLDFSKRVHDSECNSRDQSGVALKKAKVQSSSSPPSSSSSSQASQASLKVRKEKLGDRVAALHQLVSPFGKTDTASVLQEAIGYIRFLHSQIEALTSPYIATGASHLVQGEGNCLFTEDSKQGSNEEARSDLKSRGLCLVPVSITPQIGSENGADYWAPSCCASSVAKIFISS